MKNPSLQNKNILCILECHKIKLLHFIYDNDLIILLSRFKAQYPREYKQDLSKNDLLTIWEINMSVYLRGVFIRMIKLINSLQSIIWVKFIAWWKFVIYYIVWCQLTKYLHCNIKKNSMNFIKHFLSEWFI